MSQPEMNQPHLNVIEPELYPGEKIQWIGNSSTRAIFLHKTPTILFGIVFAIAPFVTKIEGPLYSFKHLLSLGAFVFFAVISIRIIYYSVLQIISARTTVYAVTDRRIIEVVQTFNRHVDSIKPSFINIIEHKVHRDGTGTVLFRKDDFYLGEASGIHKTGFRGIQNASEAIKALNELQYHALPKADINQDK